MSNPVLSVVERLPAAVTCRQTIAILEEFLADARAGRLVAVPVAGVTADRASLTACSATDERLLILGSLVQLTHRISAAMDAGDDEGPPQHGA